MTVVPLVRAVSVALVVALVTGSREDPSSTQEAVGQPSGHPVIWIAVGIAVVVLGGGAAVLAVYLRRRKSGQS